jgi:hypothetical protein
MRVCVHDAQWAEVRAGQRRLAFWPFLVQQSGSVTALLFAAIEDCSREHSHRRETRVCGDRRAPLCYLEPRFRILDLTKEGTTQGQIDATGPV